MKLSLFLLFCIVVAILALFKNYDEFKGGRGFRIRGSGSRGPFTIVDAVLIVLLLFWFFIQNK
jgi:hypothetical protein